MSDTAIKAGHGEMSVEELFDAYRRAPSDELKWEIVLRHTDLIKCIASQSRGVYSSFAEMDDVVSEGLIVLADAVDKFDPERGSFANYVSKRIRGMIIDLARKHNWVPRLANQRRREMNQAIDELREELGRYPTDQEVAERLDIGLDIYRKRVEQYAIQTVISWEELVSDQAPYSPGAQETFISPEQSVEDKDLLNTLAGGISSLRDNQQMVLSLYYQEGLTMGEIAQVMGITRSRVCQIHKSAIQRLREIVKS